jgi:uncharacterized 2Fe-2S/4Fe-4S cluster protein (DUF4445 family)
LEQREDLSRRSAMSSHIVVFQPDGVCVEAGAGQSLLEVARGAGVAIDSACGGQGACGKCKVSITLGRTGGEPGDLLSREEVEAGTVLACQATVTDDLVVEIPPESQRGELQILMAEMQVEEAGGERGVALAERASLELAPPKEEETAGDGERLLEALSQSRGEHFSRFEVDLGAMRSLPLAAREGNWQVDALVGDFEGRGRVFGVYPGGGETTPEERRSYGVAVDVGTTTVVVHLIDLETAGFLDACAALNEQISQGEDVISRIIYTQEHEGGLDELRDDVRHTINRCVSELTEERGIAREQVIGAACVGNTVMTHLLLGIDPAAIRRDPYVPAVRSMPVLRGAEVGLAIHPAAPVYLAPCVSSYVGGDVTAGVLATGMGELPRLTLFIDLGTNGEMVVGSEEWLMCCSCSAGPAFEGSGVEYGMYATIGAMERVSYDPHTDTVDYMTIGNARPRGICGSGLVDALATMLRAGVIDRAGRVNLGFPSPRVRVREERPEFVLVWGEEVGRADDISLGEDGIQNLIRSKSAVYAGATTLLESVGLRTEEVEAILVAGAFGNYLDAENAVMIGLLPDVPLDRIRFVGNTAVAGARLTLLSRRARQGAEELARRMTNFELSTVPRYMESYVSGLFLPHTDLGQFRSVAEKLELEA